MVGVDGWWRCPVRAGWARWSPCDLRCRFVVVVGVADRPVAGATVVVVGAVAGAVVGAVVIPGVPGFAAMASWFPGGPRRSPDEVLASDAAGATVDVVTELPAGDAVF